MGENVGNSTVIFFDRDQMNKDIIIDTFHTL